MNRNHSLNECLTRLQHIQSRIGTPQEKSDDQRLVALLSHQIAQQLHRRATESHQNLQRKILSGSLPNAMNPRLSETTTPDRITQASDEIHPVGN